jgi:hypothetical protein
MNNLLETVSAFSKVAKAIAGLVFWALVRCLLIAMCFDQASHREPGATSTSTSTTPPPSIVLLLVC